MKPIHPLPHLKSSPAGKRRLRITAKVKGRLFTSCLEAGVQYFPGIWIYLSCLNASASFLHAEVSVAVFVNLSLQPSLSCSMTSPPGASLFRLESASIL